MSEQQLLLGTNLDTGQPFYISTQRLATKKGFILGQSGAGKTWASAVVVEGMMDLGITVVVFDLINMWSGLALDREGKKPAYPIAIFGGKSGHYRLVPDMGNAIAKTIYAKRWSTVINLSGMTEAEQYRVTADIVRKTFELHEDQPRRTVFVFEEFHRFLPEILTRVENHATVAQEITRMSDMGRNNGLGMLGISLRPQDVRKRTLAQADWRLWMKMNELGAVKTANEYLVNASSDESEIQYKKELSHLATGTGYFESPSWMNVVARVEVAARKTFHRDPESDSVMDDSMLARAVDVDELKRVFSGFQTEPELESEVLPVIAHGEKGIHMKAGGKRAARETQVKEDRVPVLELHRTQSELSALRVAYDELSNEKTALESDVEQRVRLAETAAVREAISQMEQLRSSVQDAMPFLRSLVGVEAATAGVTASENGGSSSKMERLWKRVEEHPHLKERHKRLMKVLIDEHADYPNGLPKVKLAAALNISVESLSSMYMTELRQRKFIVTNDGLIGINPQMI